MIDRNKYLILIFICLFPFLAKAQEKEKDKDLPKGNESFDEKNMMMPKQNTEFQNLKIRKNLLRLTI